MVRVDLSFGQPFICSGRFATFATFHSAAEPAQRTLVNSLFPHHAAEVFAFV